MLTVYKSSAGAGKTFTLALEYIRLLFQAHRLHPQRSILAVTFTKKATGEMKQRIITELYLLANNRKSAYRESLQQEFGYSSEQLQTEAKTILFDILQDYSSMAVTTIDSFFQQIIRSFARELNLQGAYNLELDSRTILQTAVDDYFFNLPQELDKELLQIVTANIEDGKSWNPKSTILSLSNELLKEIYQTHRLDIDHYFEQENVIARYRHSLKQVEASFTDIYLKIIEESRPTLQTINETDISNVKRTLEPFYYSKDDILTFLVKPKALAFFKKIITSPQDAVKKGKDINTIYRLQPYAKRLYDMLFGEPFKHVQSAYCIQRYLSHLSVIHAVSIYIDQANRELNRLPISQTNTLLKTVISNSGDAPFVYDKVGTRIQHYMIDEFQDTSNMQWHNFRPLISETNARGLDNLLVGDVKQAIYRWRNSDIYLLQNKVQADFPYLKQEVLPNNWRSNKEIVEFNNRIFLSLSKIAQQQFNQRLSLAGLPIGKNEIESIYESVGQVPQKTDEQGFVQCISMPFTKADELRQYALKILPAQLEDIRSRNIPLGKVAVLVRSNYEGVLIADTLLQNGIQVTSAEALLLVSSPQVRLLISLLRLTINPKDKLLLLQARYFLALSKGHTSQQALALATNDLTDFDDRLSMIQQSSNSNDNILQQVSLYIEQFALLTEQSEPYLLALQDCIFDYSTTHQADAYSFLQWWDEHTDKLSLQAATDDDAVQIVTIHKSKGLEYDIVIVPFCNWEAAEKREDPRAKQVNILWATPPDLGTAQPNIVPPIVPLKMDSKLSQTDFATDYFHEIQSLYLDNLNLAYVAFTRAKRELYIYLKSADQTEDKKLYSIGELLYYALKKDQLANISEQDIDDSEEQQKRLEIFEYGVKCEDKETRKERQTAQWQAPVAHKVSIPRVRIAATTQSVANDLTPAQLGNIMHDILGHIIKPQDEQNAINTMLANGVIRQEHLPIIQTEMKQFWELTKGYDWFSDRWKVLAEQDILLPQGSTRRPDRIMISGDLAIIVDYKFGHQQREEYRTQVKEYALLLHQMGYQTKAYLCYVNLKQIIEVNG